MMMDATTRLTEHTPERTSTTFIACQSTGIRPGSQRHSCADRVQGVPRGGSMGVGKPVDDRGTTLATLCTAKKSRG